MGFGKLLQTSLSLVSKEPVMSSTFVTGVAVLWAVSYSGLPSESQEAPKLVKDLEEKIQRELKQVSNQEWIKAPLRGVVGVISELHEIPIKIDAKALKEKDLTPDLKITILIQHKTLGEALQLMLRDFGLTYVVKDGALMITTKEAVQKKPADKEAPDKEAIKGPLPS